MLFWIEEPAEPLARTKAFEVSAAQRVRFLLGNGNAKGVFAAKAVAGRAFGGKNLGPLDYWIFAQKRERPLRRDPSIDPGQVLRPRGFLLRLAANRGFGGEARA